MGTGTVGREQELAEVDRFMDGIGGGFRALIVEGEPGIGKTTVWAEGRERAKERGVCVLAARGAVAEAKLSFAALGDLLARVDEEVVAALPDPQREALEVALLRKGPTGTRTNPRAVAAGLLSVIRALAADRQVILAVDDWQWLDVPSRRALEFAVRRLDEEQVGLLCAVRSPFSGSLIGGVAEERVTRVALGPLSLAAVGRIVAARVGQPLPRPLLVRLVQASGGNPFYGLEIGRLLVDREPDTHAGGALPVPDDLRKLTASRIRRLPEDTREAVLLAAVISDPDGRSVDTDALAPAEQAGIVSVDAAGRIEFAHPLFASAASASVSAAERRELHRRAAERVDDPEQQARHLALAASDAEAAVAASLDVAAKHAASRGAPEAAAELEELAARLTPAADRAAWGRRIFDAARFHLDAGDLGRAETLAQEVLSGSAADLRSRALQLSAQLSARCSNFIDARDLTQAALAAAGDDHHLCAAIELDLVYCAVSLGDIGGATRHAQAAIAHAEAAGDSRILADALAVLTMAEFLAGKGCDQARLEKALELEDPMGATTFMMRPRVIDGMLALWSGQVDRAIEALSRVYDEIVERGQEGTAPMLSLYLVWAHLWRGDFERAVLVSDQARDAATLLEDPTTLGLALSASALAHAHVGRIAEARAEAEEALELFERLRWRSGVIWPLWALGFAALSAGQSGDTDALLAPLANQVAAMGAGDPVMASFIPDEVEALVALGEVDRAEEYLAPFERSSGELDRHWAIAVAARCRALLAAARGDAAGAVAATERALDAHDQVAMPFERARTLLIAGEICRRFKQRGKARELLEEALSTFEHLGTPLWAARARTELARIGSPGSSRDGLTETERRLAELAAAGLSNQEVAERAFVSVKTVEANLTRIYRKLGVKSRVGLANALHASDETLQA